MLLKIYCVKEYISWHEDFGSWLQDWRALFYSSKLPLQKNMSPMFPVVKVPPWGLLIWYLTVYRLFHFFISDSNENNFFNSSLHPLTSHCIAINLQKYLVRNYSIHWIFGSSNNSWCKTVFSLPQPTSGSIYDVLGRINSHYHFGKCDSIFLTDGS